MLIFDQVHFHYKKDQPVVKNINFVIQKGEFISIVGKNGCGKSTIAKLMNGLLLPKEGEIFFDNLVTTNPVERTIIQKQMGYIFQNPEDQFITTSVIDEVIFGLENIGISKEEMEIRLKESLLLVDMEKYAHEQPHSLPGGQKQRVAIAAILAMRPKLIIFDEATSMLDPQGRQQMMSLIHKIHKQGVTIVHITHHMDEAIEAERILLIHEGVIEYDGPSLQLFETFSVEKYSLRLPFAIRFQQKLNANTKITKDWKGMIYSKWRTNSKM